MKGSAAIRIHQRHKLFVLGDSAGWRVLIPVLAVLAVLASAISRPALAGPMLTGASIGEQSASETRLVLNLTRPVEYQVFTLADPDRVVIDLPHTGRAGGAVSPVPPGLIEQIRYGRPSGDSTRIVLDCARPAKIGETYLMKPGEGGYRLVVHLHPLATPATRTETAGSSPLTRTDAVAFAAPPPPLARPQRDVPAAAVKASLAGIAVLPPPRRPAPATQNRDRVPERVVVIDAGHGGKDPGAISSGGSYEKRVTLAAARDIREALLGKGGYKVVLTRNRDIYIPLRERVAAARRANADAFVSIHADTMADPLVRGLSAYTLSERSSDAEAEALAERENKADLISGISFSGKSPEVAEILITLAQRQTMNSSVQLARSIVSEVRGFSAVLPNTHRFAGFAVLKAPDIPSVLVELGFLSNAADERLLNTPAHRKKVAAAIADGIDRYFAQTQTLARLR